MKTHARFLCLITATCLITSGLALAGDNWSEQDWVKESNANTMIVMEAQAKFSPESFASLGIEKYDEKIITDNRIISLPERDAVIRMATEAESSAIPAPFLSPPQLIGNTGQPAEFVLVTTNPTAKEGEAKMDDWGHDGMTWSLTVHEARPGHELQFASMIESGVSQARGIYAFNSANVEGWALYAEAVMKEYLPLGRNSESLDYFPRHSCCCVGRS